MSTVAGQMIRVVRGAKGMSQRDLAERVGVGFPYISKIETGRETPSPALVEMLAAELDLDADALHLAYDRCPPWALAAIQAHPTEALGALLQIARRGGS